MRVICTKPHRELPDDQNGIHLGSFVDSGVFTRLLTEGAVDDGPLKDLSISIKDNIDVRGVVTTAGSKAFLNQEPASNDAPIVARLRSAGARLFAKTNMSEFAYSTVGVNEHFGTPVNPWSRGGEPRVPGGSSSGAAVAIALGIGDAAIGTDTAGSARVPAALCGVVGFKATQSRISVQGIVPLSSSYDSVGILARDVETVERVFNVIADTDELLLKSPANASASRPYRLLLPTNFVDDASSGIEREVADAFATAISKLEDAGIEIVRSVMPLFPATLDMLSAGGLTAPEALAYHMQFLPRLESQYEAFTLKRLEFGKRSSKEMYESLVRRRRELMDLRGVELAGFDGVLHPTCTVVPPLLSSVVSADDQAAVNLKLLRNTCLANVLDLPSISLPCHEPGTAPVGLGLTGTGSEEDLLSLSKVIEQAIR